MPPSVLFFLLKQSRKSPSHSFLCVNAIQSYSIHETFFFCHLLFIPWNLRAVAVRKERSSQQKTPLSEVVWNCSFQLSWGVLLSPKVVCWWIIYSKVSLQVSRLTEERIPFAPSKLQTFCFGNDPFEKVKKLEQQFVNLNKGLWAKNLKISGDEIWYGMLATQTSK